MKPISLSTYIFLGLVGLVMILGWVSFTKNEYAESQRIEKEQAKKRLKIVRDSVTKVIQRKDGELLEAMRESSEADMLAEEAIREFKEYKQKHDKIPFRPTRNNRERDSLIRAVLHN